MKSWKNTSYFNDEIDVQEKRQYDPEKKKNKHIGGNSTLWNYVDNDFNVRKIYIKRYCKFSKYCYT